MARTTNPDINFLEIQREQARDEPRQLREAENVLSSYSHALDFLAEALQNAADAIDERRAKESDAPARIEITFDTQAREVSVADTGVGMRSEDVRVVLTPNVTTKSGRYARGGRSRGEKGVGLSFLALGSNYLHIRTCDGLERQEVTVTGARDWVRSDGSSEKPVGKHVTDAPDEYLGSKRYTVITLGGIDAEDFDRDLFNYQLEELVWDLRTKTALGNTRYLFEQPFSWKRQADEIQIILFFVDETGNRRRQKVPYAYGTPEELAERPVIDFDEVADLPADEQVRRLRGAAVRYVRRLRTPSNRVVSLYAYITNGDEMRALLERRRETDGWAPRDWQGFFIGTREMATGVPLGEAVIPTRAYERRVFALIVEDNLVLDMGRKTLHGQTRHMLAAVVRSAWKRDLSKVVPRVGPEVTVSDVDRAALQAAIDRALRLRNLDAPIPYLKTPGTRTAVVAIFHELIGAEIEGLSHLRTLQTGTFAADDELIYRGDPNGVAPMHVLFGLHAVEVVDEIEERGALARTADLAVVWDLRPKDLAERGVTVTDAEQRDDGATHVLRLRGVAGLNQLRVVTLRSVIKDLG
jgi:hypothetical protein